MKLINRKQFIVLLLSLILLILIILFPPWGYVVVFHGEYHVGYRWLFSEKVFNGKLVEVNFYKRDMQIIILLIVTAFTLFIFRSKGVKKPEPEPEQDADDQRLTVLDDKTRH